MSWPRVLCSWSLSLLSLFEDDVSSCVDDVVLPTSFVDLSSLEVVVVSPWVVDDVVLPTSFVDLSSLEVVVVPPWVVDDESLLVVYVYVSVFNLLLYALKSSPFIPCTFKDSSKV